MCIRDRIWANARERKLPVHLDGARIFNAATTLGGDVFENVRTLTRGFDTVMFCLSKALCAPVGSMLVGSQSAMDEARVYRKALGGGMRQAGVLAAAGLIALEKMSLRLGEDHANARMLAETLAALDEVEIDLEGVQSNIVVFSLKSWKPSELVAALKTRGILMSTVGPRSVRLVTHHDADRAACETAAEALRDVLAGAAVSA